jgi:hypothetical protein
LNRSRGFPIAVAMALSLLPILPARATQIGDLPGEDISGSADAATLTVDKTQPAAPAEKPDTWLAPSTQEQLSRDRTLIPLGKGALFLPTFTEPRREPEVSLYDSKGDQVRSGQNGGRIFVDSGSYTVRFGSGTTGQQMTVHADIEEGHTFVVQPTWGGLLVETLTPNGDYIDGQYEVIRMDRWINYGKGHGLTEERLQDIKVWMLPPGLYRISKPGEGFTSLTNDITIQINPGELSQIELIFDKAGGDVVAGGVKSLSARVKMGSNWSFGARAGGNLNLTRVTDEGGVRKEAMQVSSDIRLKALYDNVRYLGSSELLLQDNFSKDRGRPFIVTSDIANARTNWVRRLNAWLGPYVRGSVDSHLFPRRAERDTIYIIRTHVDPGNPGVTVADTSLTPGSRDFEVAPVLDPMNFAEGAGVNIEFLSKYYLEASTQIGLAARQNLAFESYVARNDSVYIRGQSIYKNGIENTLNATLRLGSQATLDLRTEIFAPYSDLTSIHLDDLTADFRFFLSRNLEVGYIYQIKESDEKVKNRYPSSHSLSLRLNFNY